MSRDPYLTGDHLGHRDTGSQYQSDKYSTGNYSSDKGNYSSERQSRSTHRKPSTADSIKKSTVNNGVEGHYSGRSPHIKSSLSNTMGTSKIELKARGAARSTTKSKPLKATASAISDLDTSGEDSSSRYGAALSSVRHQTEDSSSRYGAALSSVRHQTEYHTKEPSSLPLDYSRSHSGSQRSSSARRERGRSPRRDTSTPIQKAWK